MSTSAVSTASLYQQEQQYFQTRQSDLQQLGQALGTGNLAGAQSAFQAIAKLGQGGPFASGNSFSNPQREQDFTQIGQALQSGDLAGAQQAFSSLKSTFQNSGGKTPPSTASAPSASSAGPEIVLNFSTNGPEQITLNITNQTGGGEQLSISSGSQGSTPQQVTLNLPANSNEEIVLNLLGASTGSGSSGGSASGLDVSA
ncbi:MAG: hypothetical protein WBX38_20780 [Candidatus Sulfotelmatobacter sp.]